MVDVGWKNELEWEFRTLRGRQGDVPPEMGDPEPGRDTENEIIIFHTQMLPRT